MAAREAGVAMDSDELAEGDSTSSSSLSSNYSSDDDELTWVQWYCRQRGNEFLCEVEEAYIQDDFNLTGLAAQVPYFDHALDAVLEVESPGADSLTDQQQEIVDSAAELLYGLIHARYILTSRGLHAMKLKFHNVHFGRCPRVRCRGQPVLPVGRSDIPCQDGVYVYCPVCGDIYVPKSARAASLDGAYFGRTFPHLFLMVYPREVPTMAVELFVPRIYGFRIADRSVLRTASKPKDASPAGGGGTGARAGGTGTRPPAGGAAPPKAIKDGGGEDGTGAGAGAGAGVTAVTADGKPRGGVLASGAAADGAAVAPASNGGTGSGRRDVVAGGGGDRVARQEPTKPGADAPLGRL